MLMPTNGEGPRKQKSPHNKRPHIGLLVHQPQTAWDSFGQYTGGGICPGDWQVFYCCPTIVNLMKGLYYYPVISWQCITPFRLLELKRPLERDLLATLSLSTSPLVKSEWMRFFMSPNFGANWGLSWKDTKSCRNQIHEARHFFDNYILPNFIEVRTFCSPPFIETWNLIPKDLSYVKEWNDQRKRRSHLENPPWCAISFKLRTVRWSSCSWFKLSTWLMLCLTQRDWQTSDWC